MSIKPLFEISIVVSIDLVGIKTNHMECSLWSPATNQYMGYMNRIPLPKVLLFVVINASPFLLQIIMAALNNDLCVKNLQTTQDPASDVQVQGQPLYNPVPVASNFVTYQPVQAFPMQPRAVPMQQGAVPMQQVAVPMQQFAVPMQPAAKP